MPRLMRSSRPRLAVLAAAIIAIGALGTVAIGGSQAEAAEPTVGLGTATSFAVLAGSTVTNTGPSVINGDIGVSPGTAVTGFPPGTVNGVIHAADAEALQAQKDLTVAFRDAAGRTPETAVDTELGGLTLGPGVFSGATLEITGTLTLDAGGDPDAVFIFKSASTLITASDSAVLLIGDANPCNVFFQVASSATLGTDTAFVGAILAEESITANTGATAEGRLLARTGAVTLDSNVITTPDCALAPPVPTTTAPVPTTTAPVPPTTAPVPTTTAPVPTTTAPVPPTTAPVPIKVPAPTTTVPAPTTTVPIKVPAPTTTVPGSTGDVPRAPGTPTGSDTPTGPGTPTGSDTPTGPGTPTGSDTPTGPGTPTGSDTPTGPGTPTGSETPAGPGAPTTELARTGSSLGVTAAVGGLMVAFGALVLVARRRMTAAL